MTTNITSDGCTVPNPEERTALNAALLAHNIETGFWDDNGRPAPWPDDIDEWTPHAGESATRPIAEPPHQPHRLNGDDDAIQ
jgi:hypothetical protein